MPMLMRRRQNWAPCRRPAELLRWGARPTAVRPEREKGEPEAIPQALQPPTTGVIAGALARSCDDTGLVQSRRLAGEAEARRGRFRFGLLPGPQLRLGLGSSAAILGLPALSRRWVIDDTAQGSILKDQPSKINLPRSTCSAQRGT